MKNGINLDGASDGFLSPVKLIGIDTPLTLQTKIEPLITAQANLIKNIAKFNPDLSIIAESLGRAGSVLSPIAESVQSLGSSLSAINKIAIESNLSLKIPSYDFVNEPFLSVLNSAADSIRINQNQLLSCVPNIKSNLSEITLGIPSTINQISSLGNIALDYLGSSPTLFPLGIELEESEVDILKKKVENLELKFEKLESESRNTKLTDITDIVSNKLERMSPDLAKCFRGAMATLIADQSEDLVGQVAESLTRVIEELPFLLTNKNRFSSNNKEEQIKEALEDYLGLEHGVKNIHHLIRQQQGYYTVLSGTRHRNQNVYKMYNKDINLFKALVIQIEAYIYILITYDGKN